jgi:hypothetical protein
MLAMVTVHDVRALAMSLPRTSEHLIRGQLSRSADVLSCTGRVLAECHAVARRQRIAMPSVSR